MSEEAVTTSWFSRLGSAFSGCLQAFIFAMLTMLYVAGGFPKDEYFRRKALKEANKKVSTN